LKRVAPSNHFSCEAHQQHHRHGAQTERQHRQDPATYASGRGRASDVHQAAEPDHPGN
jgi:hypothetical protein